MAEITGGKIISMPSHSNNSDSSDNGGKNMDKYVTHEELQRVADKITNRIDLLDHDMQNNFDRIPDKIEIALNEHDERTRAEHKETKRFIIGTLIIGGLSLIVGIIALFI
ncbi:hypothetical protein HFM82_14500 [Lactobacillus plantarum]|uniref:hypothetical protein n=1 Tax=Lactiplantibacillus plantarum TaxID=1590 RepID=UPI00143D4761|nr:hypothetical protein [Lactiplantibacillus plantarum]MBE1727434.1 hypothetical protein [Lactiplantibacillus plantarum]NKI39417.1 hypothetical protein [Lactiplantibacillus plantarum]